MMKKLTVVLFADDTEIENCSNNVLEKFSALPKEKEFCGIWGDIHFNNEEVLCAISATVNHFINKDDKTEIVFGCCKKDYSDIISKIHTKNCVLETVNCKNL